MRKNDSMTAKIPVAGQSVKAKTSAQRAVLTECPAAPSLALIMGSSFYCESVAGRPAVGREDRPVGQTAGSSSFQRNEVSTVCT